MHMVQTCRAMKLNLSLVITELVHKGKVWQISCFDEN